MFLGLAKGKRDVLFKDIACGNNHSLALTRDFDVYSCGAGIHGQLGHGDVKSRVNFTKIESLSEYENKEMFENYFLSRKIFAGGNHSWVI
jgi:alpha-tubulin suppressor-like RCC1 family protein